jgi:cation:H+ antiporter
MPINIAITALLCLMLLDGKLGRLDAAILLVLLCAYMFLLIWSALKNRTEESEQKVLSWTKSILFVIIGAAAIIGGGQLVVNNAKTIAVSLGMGETLVGLTVVALGTSPPELVTSIVAAKKGDSGIAMGNVVGSCIFNILFILGMAGVIMPMTAGAEFFIDTGILIAVSIMMLIFAFTNKKTNRLEGAISVLMYIAYTAYIIMRAFHIWIF